jgi:PAS domain S-box-containing protein
VSRHGRLSAATHLAVIVGPATLIVAVGILAFVAVQRTLEAMQPAARAQAVRLQTQALLSRLVDAETAERGYIVSRDERFLDPYLAARGDLQIGLDSLRSLVLDPEQARRIEQLADLATAKQDWVSANVERARAGDLRGAEAAVRSGEGHRRMEAVRAAVAEFEEMQSAIIAMREATARQRARSLAVGVIASALAAVLLAALTTHLLARHARRQAALAEDLEASNSQLSDQAMELEMQAEELQNQAAYLEETMVELEMSNDELQRAYESIRKREAEHTALLDSAGDGIYGVDPEGRCTFINRRATELLGFQPEDIVGRKLHPLIHSRRADGSAYPEEDCPISNVLRGGGAVRVGDEVLWRKDGTSFHAEYASSPLVMDGQPTGAVVTFTDVTERKKLQEERIDLLLREREARERAEASERLFRTTANSIPQLAWIADHDGAISWFNERWYDYTGTTFDQVHGWEWTRVLHPNHVEGVVQRIRQTFARGEPWEDTFPLLGKHGKYRWFLSRALPIRDDDGRVVRWFGTCTDVTEQRRTERARDRALKDAQAARDEAEVANRSKSEFLAAMSHELRTPLNAIAGYVDLMELGIYGDATTEQLQALERIRRNGTSLLALINDILQYARIEAGSLEFQIGAVPISDLLAELETMIDPQVRAAGLTYTFENCDPGPVVRGDPERIRQILLNLLTNAVKFTPAGGHVGLHCTAADRAVEIRVRDTGRGIPADMVQRIFDPFVQVERRRNESSQQGVGLGLAISRDLAVAMGGSIRVESSPGHGSTFIVMLPGVEGERCPEREEERFEDGTTVDSAGAEI